VPRNSWQAALNFKGSRCGMSGLSITGFFPAYNDQNTIEGIVRTAAEEIGKVTDDFEILVVDDGSMDQSGAILDRLALELPCLRVIHHEKNMGYGGALISGFHNARKDLIFYTDGDGQYDVREIHLLLAQLKPAIDLVNGYKTRRADAWYRRLLGTLYRLTIKRLFGIAIRDVDCDFRLFRRLVFDKISLESRSGVICVEMAKKFERAGFHMAEVPVSHYPRKYGRSEFFRFRHLVHTLFGLSKIWWNLVLSPRIPAWMRFADNKY
jgi:glycosyltransferase involved in cell wall biosynthesis